MTQFTEQKIVASGASPVTSSVHAVTARGGKTMTVDSTEVGRWIGADCPMKGDVIQQLP